MELEHTAMHCSFYDSSQSFSRMACLFPGWGKGEGGREKTFVGWTKAHHGFREPSLLPRPRTMATCGSGKKPKKKNLGEAPGQPDKDLRWRNPYMH